jgi:NAD(P)-dependent dehydrogenase (short-subunit alcohol dehydrogenase family)
MSRNVLVTGGSSSIGAATVRRFAAEGDRVWFTYRDNSEAAEDITILLAEAGAKVEAFEFHQGDRDSHRRLLDLVSGPVDVLINLAAVSSLTAASQIDGDEADFDEAFLRVNTLGPLWLIRELLPGMLSRGYGKIVNMASVGSGIGALPDLHIADGMSRAALSYLTKHLAAELTHVPVDVYAICPGAVHTPTLRASQLDGLDDDTRAELVGQLPGRRLILPDEIADLAWWLCCDEATVLRGAVLDAALGPLSIQDRATGVRPDGVERRSRPLPPPAPLRWLPRPRHHEDRMV